MNFFPGQIIRGQYKLIREIGQGGFAVAYEAIDQQTQKTVAIKLLKSSATQEERETFQHEIRVHARLHHSHIVKYLDFNLIIDPLYLVVVYAENGTLAQRTQGKVFTVTEVLTYAKPIAEALQYLHDQGIVHRDINPANILLDRKGNLLLSDFGNALPLHVVPKQVVGAPDYMSPEQINKKPAEPASDQYSLAVVMYEWLCGTVPFSGNTLPDILHGHLFDPPAPMPGVPSQVTHVIFKALSKDPVDRYPSITAFMDAWLYLQFLLAAS